MYAAIRHKWKRTSRSPAKRRRPERSFDNAIASEPRLKHPADVQRIQLLVLGAVYLRGVLVVHAAAGHVEAQLGRNSGPPCRCLMFCDSVSFQPVIIPPGRNPRAGGPLPTGGVHVVPEVHRPHDGANSFYSYRYCPCRCRSRGRPADSTCACWVNLWLPSKLA